MSASCWRQKCPLILPSFTPVLGPLGFLGRQLAQALSDALTKTAAELRQETAVDSSDIPQFDSGDLPTKLCYNGLQLSGCNVCS